MTQREFRTDYQIALDRLEHRQAEYARSSDDDKRVARERLLIALRKVVIMRDGFQCQYCGCQTYHKPLYPDKTWDHRRNVTIDHRVSLAMGGTDTLDNLVVACQSCNSSKGAYSYMYTLDEAETLRRDAAEFIASNPIGTTVVHRTLGHRGTIIGYDAHPYGHFRTVHILMEGRIYRFALDLVLDLLEVCEIR